jgi:hypothetical protein
MAVGFLCHRSVFGTATMPMRRANARTSGVSIVARTNAAAKASSIRGLKGIVIVDFQLPIADLRSSICSLQSAIGNRKLAIICGDHSGNQ